MNHSCHWHFTAFHCFPFQWFIKALPLGSVFKPYVDNFSCMSCSLPFKVTFKKKSHRSHDMLMLSRPVTLQPPLLTYTGIKSHIWMTANFCKHKLPGRKLCPGKNKFLKLVWFWGVGGFSLGFLLCFVF